jgi:hypothetical protein
MENKSKKESSKKQVEKKQTLGGEQVEMKKAPGRKEVEVLGATFEAGQPEGEEVGRWRQKLGSREDKLKYLRNGERYWYSDDWYGSERRKNPA